MKASSRALWACGSVLGCAASANCQTCAPGWGEEFVAGPGLGEVRGIAYFNEGGTEVPYAAGFMTGGIRRWDGDSWEAVGVPPAGSQAGLNGSAYTISVQDV